MTPRRISIPESKQAPKGACPWHDVYIATVLVLAAATDEGRRMAVRHLAPSRESSAQTRGGGTFSGVTTAPTMAPPRKPVQTARHPVDSQQQAPRGTRLTMGANHNMLSVGLATLTEIGPSAVGATFDPTRAADVAAAARRSSERSEPALYGRGRALCPELTLKIALPVSRQVANPRLPCPSPGALGFSEPLNREAYP